MTTIASPTDVPPTMMATRPPGRWMLLLGAGPVVLCIAFLITSVRPIVDPMLLGISVVLVASTVGTLLANRIAAGVLVLLALSTLQPVVARNISFNLNSVDGRFWNIWGIVSILSIGASVVSGLVVLLDQRATPLTSIGAAIAGTAVGVALLAVFPLISDPQSFDSDLTTTEIAALPEILMVNYAYGLTDTDIASTDTYRAKLINTSDRPHTFTIPSTDIDVYVPPRRWTIIEIDPDQLTPGPLSVICTIGDHEALGMQTTLTAAP